MNPGTTHPLNKNNSFSHILLFFPIVLLAALLRSGTFFNAHDSWDQIFYHSVAMKLDKQGLGGYNLQNVGLVNKRDTIEITLQADPKKTLLHLQAQKGFYFYDEPLFYSPPLLPYLIKISHHLFSNDTPYRYMLRKHSTRFNIKEFYITIIPLLFSLLTIIAVYLFCVIFLNQEIGFYAGLLLSVSPIDILCANRVWSDSVLTFLMFGAILLFLLGVRHKNVWVTACAGLAAGLAVLAKVSGLFTLVILGTYTFIILLKRIMRKESIWACVELRHWMLLSLVAFVLTWPWFSMVIRTFGDPLHFPYQSNVEQINHWFAYVRHRAWYTYPVDIFSQNPIWVLALPACLCRFKDQKIKILLISWLLVLWLYLTFGMQGKENRYMLPAYPVLAILTAYAIIDICRWIRQKPSVARWGVFIILCLAGMSAVWSAHLGITYSNVLLADELAFPI